MPTALVMGAPEWVPDIAIALKAAGFDVVTGGDMSADERPDLEPAVGCQVLVTGGRHARRADPVAGTAGHRPPESTLWWRYAEVDADLGFADWRDSILCLASRPDA